MFENFWTEHAQFIPVVNQSWQQVSRSNINTNFLDKLKATRSAISGSQRCTFHKSKQWISDLKQSLLQL